MKIKLLTLALAAALSNAAFAATKHNQNSDLSTGSYIIDDGAYHTDADMFHKEQVQKMLRDAKRLERIKTIDGVSVVDVGMVLHQQWIDQMKEPLTKNAEGKYYENGAQFAVARVMAQFDYFNQALENQGFNLRFNPAFITVTNHEILEQQESNDYRDFDRVRDCVYWPDESGNFINNAEACEETGFIPLRRALNGKVDLMYYIRQKLESDYPAGLGGYLSAGATYDMYNQDVKHGFSIILGQGWGEKIHESMRFGQKNAAVFMHEIGHNLEAYHEVSESEPIFPDFFGRAYGCGSYKRSDNGEETNPGSKRLTIMGQVTTGAMTDYHSFFSSPDITVEGEPCGVSGEADNAFYVRKNGPIAAALHDLPEATSSAFFVTNELVLNRGEGKGTILIRRTGDLTQPAFINVLASDDTAWEQRDFDFGLKVVEFQAGESEKTIEFKLLERPERHSDASFTVKIIKALHSTIDGESVKVTIVSDNAQQSGEVGFKNAQSAVTEGDAVEVEISRINGADGDVTFNVTTANGTATAGLDYKALDQTVTIKNGENAAKVLLETTKRSEKQGVRTVLLNIKDIAGATVGAAQSAVTISDASESGSVSFNNANVSAVETGTVTLNVTRTNGSDGPVSVNVKTVNGTAVAGTDFTAVDQVVNFADGQTSASVTISMLNRSGSQGARTFTVQMSIPVGGVALGSVATATVTINDVASQPGQGGGNNASSGGSGGASSVWFIFTLLLLSMVRRKV